MDYLYLFKIIYNNIDSVVISLITGIITSLFVTRIFLIKQLEDEKIQRLSKRRESLAFLYGLLLACLNVNKKDKISPGFFKPIKGIISRERSAFISMSFEGLDKRLHSISEEHNDLIEEMDNKINICNSDIARTDAVKWCEKVNTLINQYNERYNMKTHQMLIYKNLILDKFTIIITVLIIACILIA